MSIEIRFNASELDAVAGWWECRRDDYNPAEDAEQYSEADASNIAQQINDAILRSGGVVRMSRELWMLTIDDIENEIDGFRSRLGLGSDAVLRGEIHRYLALQRKITEHIKPKACAS